MSENVSVVDGVIPLISVAMPVYNGESYLAEAIDSILAQTFKNFELIIINDGSTDGSLDILESYEKCDARIRLISRENRNLVATLNEIIDLARGKWIARMDQDDIALQHRLERQLEWLNQTGGDICGSGVKFFGTSDRRTLMHPQTNDAINMALLFGCAFAHPTVMMKTVLVRQLRYDDVWEKCEDYDLWERAAQAGWKMTNVPEVLLLYRQHEGQISTVTSVKQQELTQKIRRRHWEFVFNLMKLNNDWIDEVLKLRAPSLKMVNMDAVDLAFIELLKRNKGEAHTIIFEHATRLYFRAAANCPDVAIRWNKMNQQFGSKFSFGIILKLWLLSTFRFGAESNMFQQLKKIYFRINELF